jgi:uncharacterized protein (TIGR02996 family)
MSPPSDHEPFLRAICEAPDDDAPRLVFADWLDEQGDPDRAEFIRLHIQLARDPDAVGIERRCEDLFRAKGRAWVGSLPGTFALWAEFVVPSRLAHLVGRFDDGSYSDLETLVQSSPSLTDWDRGFPAAVYVQGSSDVFFATLDRIGEFVPVCRVHMLNVDDPNQVIEKLATRPLLQKLRYLILPWVTLSDDAAMALANSPHATGLRYVSLVAERMTDRAGRAFAESPYLSGLEMLHLLHNEFNGSTKALLRARFGFNVHC